MLDRSFRSFLHEIKIKLLNNKGRVKRYYLSLIKLNISRPKRSVLISP